MKKSSNVLPTPEDPAKQFNHYLFRALFCIALMVDGIFVLGLLVLIALAVFGGTSDSLGIGIFSVSITGFLVSVGLPLAIITILLYMGYGATKLKRPY